jgi:hypothetical protein
MELLIMKRISFRLISALLTFALGIAGARLADLYPKSEGHLVAPVASVVEPVASAPVRVQQQERTFRFVEETCESGCNEHYESSDGQPVTFVYACHSGSPADARRDMQSFISDGTVFTRGWQRDRRGRRGERTVVLYPTDETGAQPAKIYWYHRGDICFSYIEAGSLELALEFERSDVGAAALAPE